MKEPKYLAPNDDEIALACAVVAAGRGYAAASYEIPRLSQKAFKHLRAYGADLLDKHDGDFAEMPTNHAIQCAKLAKSLREAHSTFLKSSEITSAQRRDYDHEIQRIEYPEGADDVQSDRISDFLTNLKSQLGDGNP